MTEAQRRLREWRSDPLKFAVECFHFEPDLWQADVLRAAGRPGRKRIAMKACAGPGKSAILSILGWHRLLCFAKPGEHPKGAAVSITEDNLSTGLWAELAKWQGRSELLKRTFTWTKTRISANDHPETWFLGAKSYSKTADPEAVGRTMSGLHSLYPFYLIDESGDMPAQMSKSAEQGLSTCEDGLIATAGNPTSTTGMLYSICQTNRGEWDVYEITGDPDDPKRSPRVDIEWAKEQIEKYGRDNPWVMSFILGKFPPGGINSLLSLEDVMEAMKRHPRPEAYEWAQKRLGIDVARFGDDRTVIFPRQGIVAFPPDVMRHKRDSSVSVDIANRVMVKKMEWGSEMEIFDDTVGWAHGAIDVLRAAGHSPYPVNYAGQSPDPRYFNLRSYMWMKMADWVKAGGTLPNLPELTGELTAPTYFFTNGKMRVEEKDQIKKRLGKSPDLADALAETFAIPDQPGGMTQLPKPTQAKRFDYDPLANF